MTAYVKPKLSRYEGLIMSLVPHAQHSRLTDVIRKACDTRFKGVLSDVRYEIETEIKNLAKPCERIIDLRSYFEDCLPYPYQNITHYLDEPSKEVFEKGLSLYNGYNIVTYMDILHDSKSRFHEKQKATLELTGESGKKNNYHAVIEQPLINQRFCTTPKLDHSSDVRWTYRDIRVLEEKEIVEASTQVQLTRCDDHRLRLRFEPDTEIPTKDFYLYLHKHDSEISTRWEHPEALSIAVSIHRKQNMGDGSVQVDVCLNDKTKREVSSALKAYSLAKNEANQRLNHEQYEPLASSVLSKCHEQWWSGKTQSVTMLCARCQSGWRPSSATSNAQNEYLWDFFSDSKKFHIDRLGAIPAVHRMLEQQQTGTLTLGIIRHNDAFFFEQEKEVLHSRPWQNAIHNNNAVLLRLHVDGCDSLSDSHVPSALPNHIGGEFALLNLKPQHNVAHLLKASSQIIVIEDISALHQLLSEDMAGPTSEKTTFKLAISSLPLPEWSKRIELKRCEITNSDLRREDRYNCALDVEIKGRNGTILKEMGTTDNISPKGMRIKVSGDNDWEPGASVKLTFKLDFGRKSHKLSEQPYQIVGVGEKDLRLEFAGTAGGKYIADKAIQQFIYKNINDITLNEANPEDIQGLSRATQNVAAANLKEVPFFIHQNKQQWHIRSVTTNGNNASEHFGNEHRSYLELLDQTFNTSSFRDVCLRTLNSIDNKSPIAKLYIATGEQKGGGESSMWARPINQINKKSDIEKVVNKFKTNKSLRVFEVTISRPHAPNKKHFENEFVHLKKLNTTMASDVQTTIDLVAGVGVLRDVTQETIDWVELNSEKAKLANAS